MGCQDKSFLLDGEKRTFSEVPGIVPYIVDLALSGRHKEVWQFNPSTLYGKPRPLTVPVSDKPAKTPATTSYANPQNRILLLSAILVAVLSILIAVYLNTPI